MKSAARANSREASKMPSHWHGASAEDVIDFAWAADPDYVHTTAMAGDVTSFLQQPNAEYDQNWADLPEYTAKAMAFSATSLALPYPRYSVIRGGDGGMEYPMATLITGHRSLRSLVGVTVHEMAHSWFQALLATNEPVRIHGRRHDELRHRAVHAPPSSVRKRRAAAPSRFRYISQALSGNEEPLITHADHYQTNRAYGVGAYSKGETLLAQLAAVDLNSAMKG